VLRFHSRLIDPAMKVGAPITAVAIRYVAAGGVAERELCYFGKVVFLTHAWKVMGVEGFTAQLRFGEPKIYRDRHAAAEQTRAEVIAMREMRPLAVE
jgi:hypothetical protein